MFGYITEILYFCSVRMFYTVQIYKNIAYNANFKQKFNKMGFSEYMKSLPYPRSKAVEEIASLCKVSNSSVYRWIQGKSEPNALCRGLVSGYLGMQESELFPNCQ